VTSPENSTQPGGPPPSPENSAQPDASQEEPLTPEQVAERMAADIKAQELKMKRLRQHNEAELKAIGQMGIELDASAIAVIRLDTFIKFIFARLGNASPELRQMLTLLFETEYQEAVSESLKDVKSEVRKAMIGAAGNATKEQLQQMFQQQNGHGGLLGPRGGQMPPGFGGPG
jgi:hypothetical protein